VVKVFPDVTVIAGYAAHSRNCVDCSKGKPRSQKELWGYSGIH